MTQTIEVQGMSCEGCESNVKEAIESVAGVTGVNVDHNTDSATIEGDANRDELEQAVTEAGYEVVRS